MNPYYQDETSTIYHGDCTDVIGQLPDQSVDCVVTSPPYAEQRASTYGGIPESEYPRWTVGWMEPLKRVLKPRGSVIINIRPHVHKGVISDYTLHTRLLLRTCGWSELDELVWYKPGAPPLGHPGRPRRSWESLHWFGLSGDVWCDPKSNGSMSKSVGLNNPSRSSRHGWGHVEEPSGPAIDGISRCSDVASFATRHNPNDSDDNRHPAPYPPKLAAWLIRLVCPPGGTVLDPFCGSASTGVAAIQESRRFIGIDLVEEYAAMSARRLAKEPLTLLGGAS